MKFDLASNGSRPIVEREAGAVRIIVYPCRRARVRVFFFSLGVGCGSLLCAGMAMHFAGRLGVVALRITAGGLISIGLTILLWTLLVLLRRDRRTIIELSADTFAVQSPLLIVGRRRYPHGVFQGACVQTVLGPILRLELALRYRDPLLLLLGFDRAALTRISDVLNDSLNQEAAGSARSPDPASPSPPPP